MKKLRRGDVKHIVVHCAATRPSMDIGAEEIDRWHRNFGWRAIGYHWVVRRDGELEMGRPLDQRGAHVSQHNHHSIGICLVGGVTEHDTDIAENNFTDEQFQTLFVLLLTMSRMFPNAEVLGHRDFEGVRKACPSFDVRAWMEEFTARRQIGVSDEELEQSADSASAVRYVTRAVRPER